MQIQHGLFAHMVLQRAGDASDAPIGGTCRATGPVTAAVRGADGIVPGCDGAVIGQAAKGKFSARLTGVPVGGPYTVELYIGREKAVIDDVLVGDVWICAGQSNMQGCGARAQAAKPHPRVRAFYMDDRWAAAQDPIHNMWDCVDPVHIDLCGGVRPTPDAVRGVGPGVAFAQEMHRLTGVPQGVLACAHGGTSMAQWNPTLTTPSGSTLYSATIRRLRKNGGRVAGIVWYQGCSDAFPEPAAIYTDAMIALVKAFRRDCKDAKLPFVLVQIASVHGWDPNISAAWNSIQEQQRNLPARLPRVLTVPAIDLGLDDGIHISGEDQQRLGARLAGAMATLTGVTRDPAPIALKSLRVQVNPLRGSTDMVVEFANVVGALRAEGRPNGFAIAGEAGVIDTIFRVDLEGHTAILHTNMNPNDLLGMTLHYGLGLAPYCNITDAADRALPVFGPVTIGEARALTPFARQYRVSGVQPLAAPVNKLAHPDLKGLQPKMFEQDFANLHPDILASGAASGVVYYACRFTCPEPMKLNVCLGYDGPVRAWVDGVARYTDPKGVNPAYADQGVIPLHADAGTHEVVVALDINHGAAWGIHLRLQRKGVAVKKIGTVAMPVLEG